MFTRFTTRKEAQDSVSNESSKRLLTRVGILVFVFVCVPGLCTLFIVRASTMRHTFLPRVVQDLQSFVLSFSQVC